jgi:RimJ/RimL family protein N-acetyltransferase
MQATVLQIHATSIRLIERADFEREGLLRSYRMVRGTQGDVWTC